MPFNLLANKQPSAAHSPSTDKDEGDPSHPIFTVRSTDTEERKLTVFRKMFSFNTDSASRKDNDSAQPDMMKKRSSLVPPNYVSIFTKRHFPLTRTSNKSEWAEQLISVPNNGIRSELADMYQIFEQMEKRPLVLTSDDVNLFYDWFNIFLLIVEEMFLLEETCLYAWIEKADELSAEDRKWEASPHRLTGELSEARRLKQKGKILKLGSEIRAYGQHFYGRPVLQSLPGLAAIVEQFTDELIAYLDLKKLILPGCIKARLSHKDRARFEKNYWLTTRRMEMPAYTVIASTRWMDRQEVRRWKAKWFAGPGKGIYGKWKKVFDKKHREIIDEFKRRVEESQQERDTQVMMHEMTLARVAETPAGHDSEQDSITRESCGSCGSSFHASFAASINALPPLQTC